MQVIIDYWGLIIIDVGIAIAVIVGAVQRAKERKYFGVKKPDEDVLGTVGKVMGNAVFRGMPTDITGMPPSGHFQKPDFSYDEEEETAYSERYEQ